jgi:hypothetical protein
MLLLARFPRWLAADYHRKARPPEGDAAPAAASRAIAGAVRVLTSPLVD